MEAKLKSAEWALENDLSVIICNGKRPNTILASLNGENVGTFFTNSTANLNNSIASTLENLTLKGI